MIYSKDISKNVIKFIVFCITFCFVSCNSDGSMNQTNFSGTDDTPKSAEELKYELKQVESDSPLSYLDDYQVTLQPQRIEVRKAGLFRDAEYRDDGAIIQGLFKSSASVVRFKDIKVKVSYFSQTKTLIDEQIYVIYKYINPNSTIGFSFKVNNLPQAYRSFSFEIIDAVPTE